MRYILQQLPRCRTHPVRIVQTDNQRRSQQSISALIQGVLILTLKLLHTIILRRYWILIAALWLLIVVFGVPIADFISFPNQVPEKECQKFHQLLFDIRIVVHHLDKGKIGLNGPDLLHFLYFREEFRTHELFLDAYYFTDEVSFVLICAFEDAICDETFAPLMRPFAMKL